jgi:hypothetical protein
MINLLCDALRDGPRNMNSLFGYNLGEVKVVTARMMFLVSGFGSGTETLALRLKHEGCGDQIPRLKNYPVLDTVGPTFQVSQKGTLPWLKKIRPFG